MPLPVFYFMTMEVKNQEMLGIKWQKHPKFTPIELMCWLIGLMMFGWLYNKWVDILYERGEEHIKTDRLVVWGVMVTMLPAARFLTPWEFIRIALLFCASGSMVILGHQRRLQQERRLNQSYQKALRNAKKL